MTLFQSIGMALDTIRLHKLRAFLTMLGVIIGVMAVTLIAMISSSFQGFLQEEFSKLGSNLIIVLFNPDAAKNEGLKGFIGLTEKDVSYLKKHIPNISAISGVRYEGNENIQSDYKEFKGQIRGVDSNYLYTNDLKIVNGRSFSSYDFSSVSNVCIIDTDLAKELFPGASPIGKYVVFKGIVLEVIGVVSATKSVLGGNFRNVLYLPLPVAIKKWNGERDLSEIIIKVKQGLPITQVAQEIWETLMVKYNNKPIFRVIVPEVLVKQMTGIVRIAGLVLGGVGALSLFVGGVGIMNIMLVSVMERTREIGLRKALGAKNSVILTQFLVESITVSLVGGMIGMFLAWLLGVGATMATRMIQFPSPAGLEVAFSLNGALIATFFSILVGVIFGYYPAKNAAKMDPIVALKRE